MRSGTSNVAPDLRAILSRIEAVSTSSCTVLRKLHRRLEGLEQEVTEVHEATRSLHLAHTNMGLCLDDLAHCTRRLGVARTILSVLGDEQAGQVGTLEQRDPIDSRAHACTRTRTRNTHTHMRAQAPEVEPLVRALADLREAVECALDHPALRDNTEVLGGLAHLRRRGIDALLAHYRRRLTASTPTPPGPGGGGGSTPPAATAAALAAEIRGPEVDEGLVSEARFLQAHLIRSVPLLPACLTHSRLYMPPPCVCQMSNGWTG